jgi:hypothetical protein
VAQRLAALEQRDTGLDRVDNQPGEHR